MVQEQRVALTWWSKSSRLPDMVVQKRARYYLVVQERARYYLVVQERT